jgi:hypothetical protein
LGLREDGTVRADFFENELFRFTQPHKLNDPVEAMPALVYDRYTERDRGVARERWRPTREFGSEMLRTNSSNGFAWTPSRATDSIP